MVHGNGERKKLRDRLVGIIEPMFVALVLAAVAGGVTLYGDVREMKGDIKLILYRLDNPGAGSPRAELRSPLH